jgi:SAM-dependent methyltransferase
VTDQPEQQMHEPDYLLLNRANWDDRAVLHAEHGGYDLGIHTRNPDFLTDVVTFDRPRLGDLTGVRGVHLQCHLGTDTLSLTRLGAAMTGLDLSPKSLEYAARLAADAGVPIEYVLAPVYDAVAALGGPAQFDLVYTGIGALCWLPSIDRWAGVVADLLVPGGRLFLREGHPVAWALGDRREDGVVALEFPYFELPEPTEWDEDVTYVDVGEQRLIHTRTQQWNHGLAEIITALQRHGLTLAAIEEHDSAPWAFLGDQTVPHPDHPGEFRLRDRPWRLAATYTLQAVKTG